MSGVPTPLELTPLPGGHTRLRLRVRPGGRRNAVLGEHGGALRVTVAARPERGKANEAVVALLADVLGLPLSALEIASGRASPDKVVVIRLAAAEVRRRLRLG